MKLLFCGDVVLNSHFITFSNSIIKYFNTFDYRITNFEGSIINENSKKLIKCGPHVNNHIYSIDFLKSLNFNYVALANNHILDYGANSLEYTINLLKKNKIEAFGAGLSFDNAYEPLIIEKQKEKICIINACQAEFGVLKEKKYNCNQIGYAWINSPLIKKIIKENLIKCDKVILFIHAGMENQIIPLPEWKQVYHEFANIIEGKGIIVATHPHIVQGYEIYNKTPIYYSMGNFVFYNEEQKNNVEWNRSLIVSYDTQQNVSLGIPVSINNMVLDFDNTDSFKNDIKKRCDIIQNDLELQDLANQIAEKSWKDFYKSYYELINNNKRLIDCSLLDLIKEIIKRSCIKVLRKKIKTHETIDEIMLLHNIQIESHRWCVERYLYNHYQK